ncbi:MAG TPA: class IV adenylate cyclase [Candidatus Thermoplasmatota archaeon]|nr:class IV adenylate cyclase [Candidatus Thermoplasmatota archaeon]
MLEVEAKLRVPDHAAVRARLAAVGARRLGAVLQQDTFFRHPCRDLAAGDETLRLRCADPVPEGGAVGAAGAAATHGGGRMDVELTYKGPRAAADQKVRREESVRVRSDPTELLRGLGFEPAAVLRKLREDWAMGDVQVALDTLEGVGCFVEVEVLGADAGAASAMVEAAVERLGLGDAPREALPYVELARRAGVLR